MKAAVLIDEDLSGPQVIFRLIGGLACIVFAL